MSNRTLFPLVLATTIAAPLQSELRARFLEVMRNVWGLVVAFVSQAITPETTAEFEKNWRS